MNFMNWRFKHGGVSRRMVAMAAVFLVGIGLAAAGAPFLTQETPKPPAEQKPISASSPHAAEVSDCENCHTCAAPTAENPCLRACGRPRPDKIVEQLQQGAVPEGVILLDMLSDVKDVKDRFGPVPFDHPGHAKWAEIAGGCTICHHYTPEGAAHPACRTCHEISFRHEDIRKPGLKGAYHRQCMGCHREWTHETKCDVCHLSRVGEAAGNQAVDALGKDDVMGKLHPPIPEPETEVYQTKYKPPAGTKVIFRHKEHTLRFGFTCAECHRGDSCSRCHEYGKQHEQHVRTLAEHHKPCSDCHDVEQPDKCSYCHWKAGAPEPARFDHARTGWPLSRYHESASCRACHKAVPFAKLDRECNTCHAGWAPDSFDHAVTGQVLDENHKENDCEYCHIDRKFTVPPTCEECHDEDEGVSFPAQRPGPIAKPEARKKD